MAINYEIGATFPYIRQLPTLTPHNSINRRFSPYSTLNIIPLETVFDSTLNRICYPMIRRQYSKLSISLAVCILFAIITLASWYNHLQSRFYRRVELKINWAIFSEDTDCEQWLKQVSDTITYPYKPTAPDSSALKLRDCVLSDKAVRMRDRIQRIAVAFPVSGESTSLQQPLLDIIESLPNRKPEVM